MGGCVVLHEIVTGSILALGLALAAIAGRRGWAPSARVAIVTGILLRLTLVLLAAHDPSQPYDFDQDFRLTAHNVLTRQDPVLNIRQGGWHFLPLAAYMFAAAMRLGQLFDVPWRVAGRLVPMLADVVLIPLVGELAPEHKARRRFQYACAPLGLMVSSIHGQIEPIALAFGVGAFLAARRRRTAAAGVLLGLSITTGSWPVLLAPGVLRTLRSARDRLIAFGWAVAVPAVFFVTTPLVAGERLATLVPAAKTLLSTRPVVGDWGWTPWFTGGNETLSPVLARIGMILLLAALATAAYLWRRADPVDLTIALLTAFLIVTARFGAQYLLWTVPFLVGRPTRSAMSAMTAMSVWAAAGYLQFLRLPGLTWYELHSWWAYSSALVVGCMAVALPWARRNAPPRSSDSTTQPPALDRVA